MYICNWQVQLRPSSNCDLCLSLILPAKKKVISLLVPALSLLVTTPSLSVTFLISVCLSSISVSPIVSLVSHCYISFSPCFIFVSSCSISASPCSNSVSLYYICVGMSPFHLWYILFHFYYTVVPAPSLLVIPSLLVPVPSLIVVRGLCHHQTVCKEDTTA